MKWRALESNPDSFTGFLRQLSIRAPTRFIDIWSFEPETFEFFPSVIHAVSICYPTNGKVDEFRRASYTPAMLWSANGIPGLVFTRQDLQVHGNSCGAFSAMHALWNTPSLLTSTSPLATFRAAWLGKSAEATGQALARGDDVGGTLQAASEASALQGQTQAPDAEDQVESHFVTFCLFQGQLLELDGLLPGPVCHGPCAPSELLPRVAALVRAWMLLEPGNPGFVALGLVSEADDSE